MVKLKGDGFGLPIIIILVLIAAYFILSATLFQSGGGFLAELLSCETNPGLPGCHSETDTTLEFEQVQHSVKALTCSLNAVAEGDATYCDEFSEENVKGKEFAFGLPSTVDCKSKGTSTAKVLGTITFQRTGSEQPIKAALEECKKEYPTANSAKVLSDLGRDASGVYSATARCLEDEVECTISNINLPQDTSDTSGWLSFLLDPEYIVYWQSFPLDEDTWTYKVDWTTHIIAFAISVIPFGKILSLSGKGIAWAGKTAVKGAVSSVKALTRRKIAEEGIEKSIQYGYGEWAERQLILQTAERAVIKTVKASLAKKIAERILKAGKVPATALKYLAKIKRPVTIVTKFGAVEAAAYAAELADSTFDKFVERPGKIVIRQPLVIDPPTFDLTGSSRKMPILLYWRSTEGYTVKALHLVSPCNLESAKLSIEDVYCEIYTYDKDNDAIRCEKAKLKSEPGPVCGELTSENINNYLDYGAFENMESILERGQLVAVPRQTPIDLHLYPQTKGSDANLFADYIFKWDVKSFVLPWQTAEKKDIVTLEFNNPWEKDVSEDGTVGKCQWSSAKTMSDVKVGDTKVGEVTVKCGGQPRSCVEGYMLEYGSAEWKDANEDIVTVCAIGFEDLTEPYGDSWLPKEGLDVLLKTSIFKDINRLKQIHQFVADDEGFYLFTYFKPTSTQDLRVAFTDDERDGYFDTVSVEKGLYGIAKPSTIGPTLSLTEITPDGDPRHITMTGCQTKGIVMSDTKKADIEGDNYCYRQESTMAIIGEWAGRAVGAATAIIATVVSGGTITTMGILAAGSAAEGAGEYAAKKDSTWPN